MSERASQEPRELILRPLGPQGPIVGIEISEVGDVIALDQAMGQLPETERRTIRGIFKATQMAGLNIVDSSHMPDEKDKVDPIGNIWAK